VGVDVRPLGELIQALAQLDPDMTIFVAGDVVADTPSTLGPATGPAPQGYRYLLEVPVAQEVLEVWSSWRGGRNPNLLEKLEAIDYYARMDSYLPAED
jgi:hypothetical protein